MISGEVIRYAINAAFFAEIKEAHLPFQHSLAALSDFCAESCETDRILRDCGPSLHLLRDAMAKQFELEETYGYVSIRDPALAQSIDDRAQQAKAEHRTLMVYLHELSERFDGLQYQGTLVRELDQFLVDLREFYSKILRHEHREKELIQSASKHR